MRITKDVVIAAALGFAAPYAWTFAQGLWSALVTPTLFRWLWASLEIRGIAGFLVGTALFTVLFGAVLAFVLRLAAGKEWIRNTTVFSAAFAALFLLPNPFEPLAESLPFIRATLPFLAAILASVFVFQAVLARLVGTNEA